MKKYQKEHENQLVANIHINKIISRGGVYNQKTQKGKITLVYWFPDNYEFIAYHGTKSKYSLFKFGKSNLTTYSTGKEGYFSSNKDVAKTYGNVKKYKLSFKKPLIIDFEKQLFSNFHLTKNNDELKILVWKNIHKYHEKYANILLKSKEALSLEDRILLNHLIRYAKINNYDGVIANNVIDVGGETKNEIGNTYVVFNENQITEVK